MITLEIVTDKETKLADGSVLGGLPDELRSLFPGIKLVCQSKFYTIWQIELEKVTNDQRTALHDARMYEETIEACCTDEK